MPEGSQFRGLYSASNQTALYRRLDAICRRQGVPLVDARSWIADDYFSDGHHLLTEGAGAFTDRFGRDAVQPAVAAIAQRPHGTDPAR